MDLCRLVAVDLVLGRAEDFIMALCLVAEGAQTLFSVPQQRIPLLVCIPTPSLGSKYLEKFCV